MPYSKPIGQQNYEQFADRYAVAVETKAHNAYYERPATLSLLPNVKGLNVLDAGCGSGIYTDWLLQHGASVVAIDITPQMVELTRKRIGSKAKVLCADLNMPLDFAVSDNFDLVICPLVLDYVEKWDGVFAEFFRVLKSGGTLVFSCGHPLGDYLTTTHRHSTDRIYFNIELYEMEWGGFGKPRPVIKAYRRPLSEVINPLLRAGFSLDSLFEPLPKPEFRLLDPDAYAQLTKQPGFLCVRAKKP